MQPWVVHAIVFVFCFIRLGRNTGTLRESDTNHTRACSWHWSLNRAYFRSRIAPGEWSPATEMNEETTLPAFGFSQVHTEYINGVEAVHGS